MSDSIYMETGRPWEETLRDTFTDLIRDLNPYQDQDTDDIDRINRQEEIQEILDLLDAIAAGEATIDDLANYELDYLADVEGVQSWIDGIVEEGSARAEATSPDITIDQPTLPEETEQETGIDIAGAVESLLDKFPTWEDLWSKVQDQLPDNPQEWGDVIRSVIEAAGVDLPDSDIYGILNGGYGVVWNPGGIAGLPSGVGAIIQSGNIFVPGIPVGLPPSSTIIGTIGDYVNAENPIDVFVENVQGILGDVIADPAGAVTGILGQGTDVPTEVWEVLIGGAAATQGVIDWLEENGYISGSDEAPVVPPVGGEEDEEEDSGVSYGPDSPRPDDAFYQEVNEETVDPKDLTRYSTITEDNATPQPGDPDFPVLVDDTAMGDYDEPSLFDDTTDDDTTADITYGPDNPRPDDVSYVEVDEEAVDSKDTTDYGTIATGEEDSGPPETGGPNPPPNENDFVDNVIYGTDGKPIVDDSKDATDYGTITSEGDSWTPELGGPNPPPYEEDTTFEEDIYGTDGKPIVDDSKDLTGDSTIVTGEGDSWTPELGGPNPPPYEDFNDDVIYGTDGKPIVSDSDITDKGSTDYTELDVYDEPWNPELSDPLTEAEDGGGIGGGSIGGSSDPSRFRKGLTYQLFSPQPIISGSQINFAQGLLGGASSQIARTDTPVSMSLFGEYFV